MRCTPFLSCLLFARACFGEDTAVTLTADGDIEQAVPLMRKHAIHKEDGAYSEEEERGSNDPGDYHENHHTAETQAMFGSMDLNQDGLMTADEVKASALQVGSSAPKDMLKMLRDLDTDGDGAISYAEFLAAAKDARQNRVHAHRYPVAHPMHVPQHAAVTSVASVLERTNQVQRTSDLTKRKRRAHRVSCGGHTAVNCEACPTTDAEGETVSSHGTYWCNGDCVYDIADRQCHTIGTFTTHNTTTVETDEDGITAVKYVRPPRLDSASTKPDLLNPEITPVDREITRMAAEEAVQEGKLERELAEEEEREGVRGEQFSWRRFWFIVIIVASTVLGLCALFSIVAVVVFLFMSKPHGLRSPKEALLADEADSIEGEEYDVAEGEDGNI